MKNMIEMDRSSTIKRDRIYELNNFFWSVADNYGFNKDQETISLFTKIGAALTANYLYEDVACRALFTDEYNEKTKVQVSILEKVPDTLKLFSAIYSSIEVISESIDEHKSPSIYEMDIDTLCILNRLLGELSVDEQEPAEILREYQQRIGKIGTTKRYATRNELKAWTLQRYNEGKWPSAKNAAYHLKESVIEYGKAINAHIAPSNAQDLIAGWIYEDNKNKNKNTPA